VSALQESTVNEAMEELRVMLEADGYALRLDTGERSLTVSVDATEAACAECLAPAKTIELIVLDRLSAAGIETEGLALDIVMPPH
jgi:hypothetical protein